MKESEYSPSHFEESQARGDAYSHFLDARNKEDEKNFKDGLSEKENEIAELLLAPLQNLSENQKQRHIRYNIRDIKKLAANPKLRILFESNMIRGDQECLRTKTTEQIQQLKKFYADETLTPVEDQTREEKLLSFQKFTDALVPLRRDANIHTTDIPDSFYSPRSLDLNRGDNTYDLLPQGGAYVYGSFNNISHNMAGGHMADPSQIKEMQAQHLFFLDQDDIADRAEIVMMDVAEIKPRKEQETIIEMYLNNIFDYRGGKEILAYYLSAVFRSVEECMEITQAWSDRDVTQTWNRHEDDFVEFHKMCTPNIEEGRIREIYKKIQEIYEHTSLMPPMQLEVRVRNSAKIVKE